MPLKTRKIEGRAYAEIDSKGRPIYINDRGEEVGRDGEALAAAIIAGHFERSKFIAEKMTPPASMVRDAFEAHFEIDDAGQLIARHADGHQVYSKSNPGEVADFDEALQLIVASSSMADGILKGDDEPGSGKADRRAAPGGGSGDTTMTVAAFEKLSLSERNDFMKAGGRLQNEPGGNTYRADTAKTISRAEADRLAQRDPREMARLMKEGYTVIDEAA